MGLHFNGTEIPEDGKVIFNGTECEKVVMNGTTVWEAYSYIGPSSPVTISSSSNLVAGVDFPYGKELTICMCGGGGSGGVGKAVEGNKAGGGHRGQVLSNQKVTLAKNEVVAITIGSGGAKVYCVGCTKNGRAGGATKFGIHFTANGGAGGNGTTGSHLGTGGDYNSPCAGTYHDGDYVRYDIGSTVAKYIYAYGGEAGAFGHGGNARAYNDAYAGGIGAGGGGVTHSGGGGEESGAGGRGQIVISWSN